MNNKLVAVYKNQKVFSIPLYMIKKYKILKNECLLEFNNERRNSDDDVLVEMRLYAVPSNNYNKKINKLDGRLEEHIGVSERYVEPIVYFEDQMLLQPRGMNTVSLDLKSFKLHGASFTHIIPYNTMENAFYIDQLNNNFVYLIVFLLKPIIRGKTEYNSLIFQFKKEIDIEVFLEPCQGIIDSLGLNMRKKIKGDMNVVFCNIFKKLARIELIYPSYFKNSKYVNKLECSYGRSRGHLSFYDKCILFTLSPITQIQYKEIKKVCFYKTIKGRDFDIEIETIDKRYSFESILLVDHGNLINVFKQHGIKIKNNDSKHIINEGDNNQSETESSDIFVIKDKKKYRDDSDHDSDYKSKKHK